MLKTQQLEINRFSIGAIAAITLSNPLWKSLIDREMEGREQCKKERKKERVEKLTDYDKRMKKRLSFHCDI